MAGAVAGVALQQTVFADEPPPPQQTRDRDGDERRPRRDPYEGLNLSPEQRADIDSIIGDGRSQVEAFWREHGPVLEAIRDSTRGRIDRIFTPEQRAELDRRRAERRERERQRDLQRQQQRDSAASTGERKGGADREQEEKSRGGATRPRALKSFDMDVLYGDPAPSESPRADAARERRP
jgi:Spy/CpxP family protein refolding chaperone